MVFMHLLYYDPDMDIAESALVMIAINIIVYSLPCLCLLSSVYFVIGVKQTEDWFKKVRIGGFIINNIGTELLLE